MCLYGDDIGSSRGKSGFKQEVASCALTLVHMCDQTRWWHAGADGGVW